MKKDKRTANLLPSGTRADSKQKREALKKAYVNVNPEEKPRWENNENLIDWLKNF